MIRYLNRAEFAERIGVTPGALSRYRLPEPDAMIGSTRGWTASTVDEWNENRPGQGARTDLRTIVDQTRAKLADIHEQTKAAGNA